LASFIQYEIKTENQQFTLFQKRKVYEDDVLDTNSNNLRPEYLRDDFGKMERGKYAGRDKAGLSRKTT
jgi:hypothetical protein